MILSDCVVCNSKKSGIIKENASGLLSSVGIKKPVSKIPLVAPLLLSRYEQVHIR